MKPSGLDRRTAEPSSSNEVRAGPKSGVLQRKCACGQHTSAGSECAECHKRASGLQRTPSDPSRTNEAPSVVHDVLRSPGQPLDASLRTFMEPRFGDASGNVHALHRAGCGASMPISQPSSPEERQAARLADRIIRMPGREARLADQTRGSDFSQVRIHTDPQAAASARAVHALAYTAGEHIVFAERQFAPQTLQGKRLLAHELAHVWQNQERSNGMIQRFEAPEHQDLGDKNLEELFQYIQTDAGKEWAKARGLNPVQVLKQMEQDPVGRGKKIRVRAGLELTPGEIISLMGDMYGTWQDLQGAPKEEIDALLAVMKKERTGGIDANVEYEKVTKGRLQN